MRRDTLLGLLGLSALLAMVIGAIAAVQFAFENIWSIIWVGILGVGVVATVAHDTYRRAVIGLLTMFSVSLITVSIMSSEVTVSTLVGKVVVVIIVVSAFGIIGAQEVRSQVTGESRRR